LLSAAWRRPAPLLVFLAGLAACQATGPIRVPDDAPALVDVQILAFNDFHGNLEPPVGSNGRIGDVTVGGVEYFASHIARLEATNPNTVIVSAGDNIGGTPLLSSLFHDEPTVLALSALGLDFSSPGNHEFDEGWPELLRMQRGGCHPADGCQVTESFPGASYRYLSANVRLDARDDTLFPATAIRTFAGASVGFVGLVLKGAPGLVSPESVTGLTFLPEAAAANAAAAQLRRDGADVVVALIHEGGFTAPGDDESCGSMTGDLVTVLKGMASSIDVVVSGHTNRSYICHMGGRLVTSTASYGRQITDIDLTIDRRTGRLASKRAENVPVTHDVPRDPAMTALLDRYRPRVAEISRRTVGAVAGTLTRAQNGAGESTVGNAVADAFLAVARDPARGGAQIALTNWGSLRADLVHAGNAASTPITYGEAFQTLPFGNVLIVQTLTGAQLAALLEQQFRTDVRASWKVLQVSHNVRYRWSAGRPEGSRVDRTSIHIDDAPLDMNATYRVAMSDFLWAGGDAFTVATLGVQPVAVGPDLDVFIEYLARQSPLAPPPLGRITRED
jgi:5'-nucleotidase